jgi:hypothetical protein
VAFNGLVEPGSLVRDFAARGQTVKATCRAKGCNRRVELDPEVLCSEGLGALRMDRIRLLWRCARFEGCELNFYNEPPAIRLLLGSFTGIPHVRIRLRCRGQGCKFARVYLVEAMIKGLVDRKQGDGRTEIAELPSKMTGGCALCGKNNWAVDVLWADTETMGWRTLGAASFDRYGTG